MPNPDDPPPGDPADRWRRPPGERPGPGPDDTTGAGPAGSEPDGDTGSGPARAGTDDDAGGRTARPGADNATGELPIVGRHRPVPPKEPEADDEPREQPRSRRRLLRWLGGLAALVTLAALGAALLVAWLRPKNVWPSSGGSGTDPTGTPPGTSPATPGSGTPESGTPGTHGTHGADGGSTASCDGCGGSGCDSTGCNQAGTNACDDTVNGACNSTMSGCADDSSCSGSDPSCSSSGSAHLTGLLAALPAVPPMHRTGRLPARLGAAAIRGYRRRLSPRLPTRCRYTPSCSRYGLAAIERYGLLDGARLAVARIRRCTPDVPQGSVDPLPATAPAQARPAVG